MKALRMTMILFAVLLFALTGSIRADDAAEKPAMHDDMMGHCKAMDAHHDEMMAKLKDMDAKLDQMVADMNAAKGNKKVDAMAAVISEMISQRKSMTTMMHDMNSQMMEHMTEHLAMGIASGIMHSMGGCPMMKGEGKEDGGCPMGKDCPMMKEKKDDKDDDKDEHEHQ